MLSILGKGVHPIPIADEGDGREENPAAPMLHVSIGRSSLLVNEIGNSVSFLSTSRAVGEP